MVWAILAALGVPSWLRSIGILSLTFETEGCAMGRETCGAGAQGAGEALASRSRC